MMYQLFVRVLKLIITPLWLITWEVISVLTILVLMLTSIWVEDWRARVSRTAKNSYLIQKLMNKFE
jgi:hypothetical protein